MAHDSADRPSREAATPCARNSRAPLRVADVEKFARRDFSHKGGRRIRSIGRRRRAARGRADDRPRSPPQYLGTVASTLVTSFDGAMWRPSITAVLCLLAGQAFAACGDKGGPGYRSASGRCVGWADIGKTCGNPPSTRCTAENTASGAKAAADLGQKAWEAGKDARKAAGRSD